MNFTKGEIFHIDKPYGWTSFAVVGKLRYHISRRTGIKKIKVGHAGTLDPLASGVLVICTGKATKRIEELQAGVKEYVAEIKLGATTPSFDLETEEDATYPWEHITREQVEQVLSTQFVGSISQVPPAYSACKINGKRAYKMARQGDDVELKAKTLVVNEIEVLEMEGQRLVIRVVCGKGTYIRALARDIGIALGSGAHLTGLRRTQVGDVRVEKCMSIDEAVDLINTVAIETEEN
ncbi:MAG: tRNA pseudouridine(55) synthase TruB [Bacteroidales bacterium]|nr:tRNA pseudouridine(55) synthase TruB [Bacteroidales bacterium]